MTWNSRWKKIYICEDPEHELSRLKQWTCVRGKAHSLLSVFVDTIFLGAIIALTVLFDDDDDDSAGLWFSRANADLRYTQSETPSTFTTSITVWFRTSAYYKRNSCQHACTSFHVQSFTSRKHADGKSWRNLSIWIISGFLILVLYSVTSHPAPFFPARQSRMSMSLYLQYLHVHVFHHSQMSCNCPWQKKGDVAGGREKNTFLKNLAINKHYARSYDWGDRKSVV